MYEEFCPGAILGKCWVTIPKHLCGLIPYEIGMGKIDFDEVLYIEETSITVRAYRRRTTVPSKIFKFMGLKEGDSLRWIATRDGTVFVTKVEGEKTKAKLKQKKPSLSRS